jgi:AAA-like domain
MFVPMKSNKESKRRKRGVILTSQGWQRFQQAKSLAEYKKNSASRYTLEQLSDLTGLGIDTVMKVWKREEKVDKESLKSCFRAFDLVLQPNDYYFPSSDEEGDNILELELPGGQVPLNSAFYVERSHIEANCYKAILQPGALIRLKAPRRMGKTSLMTRILDHAQRYDYRTVFFNFRLADKSCFQSLDQFLRWFCANLARELQLSKGPGDYWDELFGSKMSCKIYFEQYLLTEITQPLVLGLDEVDRLFKYPDLADEFFGLLRSWHEEAKNRDIWKKLRLIVAHSTELYIRLDTNRSPFNVGLPIELSPFTKEQVEDLATRHSLKLSTEQIEELRSFLGGFPYLIRLALYRFQLQEVTWEQLFKISLAKAGIYSEHLQELLFNLKQEQKLEQEFFQAIANSTPIELDLVSGFKLQGMGLIRLQGNRAILSCQLYSQYFREYFNVGS